MSLIEIQKFAISLLSPSKRRNYLVATLLQASLAVFEIVGIALAGLIGMYISGKSENRNQLDKMFFLEKIGVESYSTSWILLILAFFTFLFFVLKSVLALLFTRKIFSFLAREQSSFAGKLIGQITTTKYEWIRMQDPHMTSTSAVLGASALVTNSLGQFLLIGAELTFLSLFIIVLLLFNPLIALIIIVYFFLVMVLLRSFLGKKVENYNSRLGTLQIANQSLLFDNLRLFREIRILNRERFYQNRFTELNDSRAQSFAKDMWIQQIPKYALEIAMLLGVLILLIVGSIFALQDDLVTMLALYFTAASRIIPSLLRVQASIFSLQSKKNYSQMAIHLSIMLDKTEESQKLEKSLRIIENSEFPRLRTGKVLIDILDVSFKYQDSNEDALTHIALRIDEGERVALIGPSGSGKSTLCDLLLGQLIPYSGRVLISGEDSANWIRNNPGKISYQPQ